MTLSRPSLPGFAAAAALLLACACGDDDAAGGACSSNADLPALLAEARAAALARGASAAAGLDRVGASLQAARAAAGPARATEALRADVAEALLAFADFEPYAYGPDGSLETVARVNPFPLDEAAVAAYLTGASDGGDFPTAPPAFDRGLPALEYAVFGEGELPAGALDDPDLDTLISRIRRDLDRARSAWEDAGAWPQDGGTAAGSALSVLVNATSRHFEDLRRDRLGTPAGVTTLGFPNPQTVQAPHAGLSLALLRRGVEASRAVFVGDSEATGLDAYLGGLDGPDAASLATDVAAQYDAILAALAAVDEPLAAAVDDGGDRDDVQAAYNALSRQVVNLKTDLPAVACIAITYVDNPSDSD